MAAGAFLPNVIALPRGLTVSSRSAPGIVALRRCPMKSGGTTTGARVATAVAVGLATLLASAIGVRVAVTLLSDMTPQVGTLIRFTPTSPPALVQVRVTTRRLATTVEPARTCVLSAQVMKADGGSLIVEARDRRTSQAVVHWAGARTAHGPGDCGHAATLQIGEADLRALAEAASGLGLEAAAALARNGG